MATASLFPFVSAGVPLMQVLPMCRCRCAGADVQVTAPFRPAVPLVSGSKWQEGPQEGLAA